MLITTVTSTGVVTVLVDNLVLPYGITTYLLINNGPPFVSEFFCSRDRTLGNQANGDYGVLPPDRRLGREVQQNCRSALPTLPHRSSDALVPVCATTDVRLHGK